VSLQGLSVSQAALLAVNPNTVSFSQVVTGSNPGGVTASFITLNQGVGNLAISNYAGSTASETGPWTTLSGTNTTSGPFTLSGLPTSIAGDTQVTVNVNFNPATDGNYALFLQINSNDGIKVVDILGAAGGYPKALLQFQTDDGLAWVNYSDTTPFTFGSVVEQHTRYLSMRLSNIAPFSAGILDITVSKPPIGVGLIRAVNGVNLGEGTEIPAGTNQTASLFCSVPKTQVNTDPYNSTAQWTMNTGDPTSNKTFIQFTYQAVSEQQDPLYLNGSTIYWYI